MNYYGVRAIFFFEMRRFFKTVVQSLLAPVISTSLYFIVFGSAIGSRMQEVDGYAYGSFIVPGLTMIAVLGQSVSNASFGSYMPRFIGTIYEILSAPLSAVEIVIGYVGAAAAKSLIIGLVILLTARFFVPYSILHPFWMLTFLLLTSLAFSLLGFIIGIWADGFDKLQIIPLMIITPLTFLGGSFYSISMLPPFWQAVSYFNPVLYLVNGFRWSFYGKSDVQLEVSLGLTFVFMLVCLTVITVIFRTGYRIKN
ncbi:MAG TPA: ABC transporter permease [Bdellovibrionota bacterium]|jgi:ABC-2 type transport system permease protein